jgi:benzylsuccinate CoA-transferase BbsF subunit
MYATADGRRAHRQEIDRRLAEWTSDKSRYELMAMFQAAGVPAGVVQRSSDLLRDPQLAHRNFFRPHEHCEMGVVPYEGHQFQVEGYPSGPRSASPCLGEHSVEVMSETLAMTEDEIAEVVSAGALV